MTIMSARKIARNYLENIGCSVTEAESGFRAIEVINEKNKSERTLIYASSIS